jgi:hypothetical protein
MDYVLYVDGGILFAFLYAAIWTAGGTRARLVLTLGAYVYHPNYDPPSRAWRRSQVRHRDRNHATDFPSWHDYFADAAVAHEVNTELREEAAVDSTPTATLPTFVAAEMAADGSDTGAEHWGGLLTAMNTEERLIYNAEILATYEATKAVERPALSHLDQAVADFHAGLAQQERRESAAFEGTWHNLFKAHGGADRWATGQYAVLPRLDEHATV